MATEVRTITKHRCDACGQVITDADLAADAQVVFVDDDPWLVCGSFCASRVLPDPNFDAKAWLRGLAA